MKPAMVKEIVRRILRGRSSRDSSSRDSSRGSSSRDSSSALILVAAGELSPTKTSPPPSSGRLRRGQRLPLAERQRSPNPEGRCQVACSEPLKPRWRRGRIGWSD